MEKKTKNSNVEMYHIGAIVLDTTDKYNRIFFNFFSDEKLKKKAIKRIIREHLGIEKEDKNKFPFLWIKIQKSF